MNDLRLDTVLEGQKVVFTLNEYTLTLAVSAVNAETMKYENMKLGDFPVTIVGSGNDYALIAKAKKVYPELKDFKNIEVLYKTRKEITIEYDLDSILNEII